MTSHDWLLVAPRTSTDQRMRGRKQATTPNAAPSTRILPLGPRLAYHCCAMGWVGRAIEPDSLLMMILSVVAEWRQGHYRECWWQHDSPRRRDARERAFVMKKI